MKPILRSHAAALCSGFVVLSCCLTVQAQAPAPAPAQAHPAQALNPAPPTQAVRNYTPKAGESLDRVIANTLADSPLKIELLRQAYVEQNPSAFFPGKVPKLRKNVVLTVPNPEQLRQKYLLPKPAAAAAIAQHPEPKPSSEERYRWVQYP
jgi:Tfp pilus assembly protein FimV